MTDSSTRHDAPAAPDELRGPVLDVLTALLAEGRQDEVIALVTRLVARNRELELLLSKLRNSKNHGEGISHAQLDLFLDKLRKASGAELESTEKRIDRAVRLHPDGLQLARDPEGV